MAWGQRRRTKIPLPLYTKRMHSCMHNCCGTLRVLHGENRKSKKEPPRQEPKLGCGGLAVQYRDLVLLVQKHLKL